MRRRAGTERGPLHRESFPTCERSPAMHEHRATVDGIPMRWLERGEGAATNLVHGIPTSPELWRRVAPRIEEARIFAWEMVGYGKNMTADRPGSRR